MHTEISIYLSQCNNQLIKISQFYYFNECLHFQILGVLGFWGFVGRLARKIKKQPDHLQVVSRMREALEDKKLAIEQEATNMLAVNMPITSARQV